MKNKIPSEFIDNLLIKVNIVDIPGFEGTMDELDNLVNK